MTTIIENTPSFILLDASPRATTLTALQSPQDLSCSAHDALDTIDFLRNRKVSKIGDELYFAVYKRKIRTHHLGNQAGNCLLQATIKRGIISLGQRFDPTNRLSVKATFEAGSIERALDDSLQKEDQKLRESLILGKDYVLSLFSYYISQGKTGNIETVVDEYTLAARIEICTKMCKLLTGTCLPEAFTSMQLGSTVEYKKAPLNYRIGYAEKTLETLFIERLGICYGSWNPTSSISDLISEIKSHGPLGVGIVATHESGEKFYLGAYKGLQTYAAILTYSETLNAGRMVLIIGAHDEGARQWVYYHSIHELANQELKATKKVYKVAYDLFKSCVTTIVGMRKSDYTKSPTPAQTSTEWSKRFTIYTHQKQPTG